MLTLFDDIEVKNTEKNKIYHIDRGFHDWYRFVLSYPPHLVRDYIKKFNLDGEDLILDPFCGTGTTIVESKIQGIPSIGIEANPFAHFASSVKTNWSIDTCELKKIVNEVKDKAINILKQQGISDKPTLHNLEVEHLIKLSPEKDKIILTDSISPIPLHKVMVLFDCIKEHKNSESYKYLLLALGNSLVYEISNLKFGPEVGVGKIKQDSIVIENWWRKINKIVKDLESINHEEKVSAEVVLGDSRDISNLLNGKKVSAVITSPPYPNEKDYTRTTRLESVLLDFINSDQELKLLKKTLVRSNTRGVYKDDNDDKYISNFEQIMDVANEIEKRRLDLGKTSGFEKLYHKVTKLYFGGYDKALTGTKNGAKTRAQLAYVVGDQLHT